MCPHLEEARCDTPTKTHRLCPCHPCLATVTSSEELLLSTLPEAHPPHGLFLSLFFYTFL